MYHKRSNTPLMAWLLCATMNAVHAREIINDSSCINSTVVQSIQEPASINALTALVNSARTAKTPIMSAGLLRSQGGQAFSDNCIVIKTKKLNNILNLDVANKTITVQAGATWKQVQEYINPYGLSVKVMPSINTVTVGGSISTDAHGSDWHFGSLGDTIVSLNLLQANGTIVTLSKTSNPELFSLVIGGLGLFGIITQATISLTNDVVLNTEVKVIKRDDYASYFLRRIKNDPSASMHVGIVSACTFDKVVAWTLVESDRTPRCIFDLKTEGPCKDFSNCTETKTDVLCCTNDTSCPTPQKTSLVCNNTRCDTMEGKKHYPYLKRALIQAYQKNPLLRCITSVPGSLLYATTQGFTSLCGNISRNNAMRESGIAFATPCMPCKKTDLLFEFFVPAGALATMIKAIGKQTVCEGLDILYTVIRYIPANTASFLSPNTTDVFSVTIVFDVCSGSSTAIAQAEKTIQTLIDNALALGAAFQSRGSYNLGYELFGSQKQIRAAFPQLDTFFSKKVTYDPQPLFINKFYTTYKTC